MAKSLDEVLGAFTPEQRARVEARAQELTKEALTVRDVLCLFLKADAYPLLGIVSSVEVVKDAKTVEY